MDGKAKRTVIITVVVLVIAGGVFIGLRGCTVMPWNKKAAGSGMVSISITRDLGSQVIKTGQVKPATGETDMDLLKRIADVKTEYGGGFVSSIEGIASTQGQGRKDWFYYVNGVLSGQGAGQFQARPGDAVWWDYHAWNNDSFIASVVGSYPQPFVRGYSAEKLPSTVVFGAGMESLARDVGAYLAKNGATVTYSSQARSFKRTKGPSIVFLDVKEAAGLQWVADLVSRPGKALVSLEGGKLAALDATGKPPANGSPLQAAVLSTGTGMGDASPVWIVVCDGAAGAAAARRVLVSDPASLALKVGAAIGPDGQVNAVGR